MIENTHRIQVLDIYLHLVEIYGKCRYHTWMVWDMIWPDMFCFRSLRNITDCFCFTWDGKCRTYVGISWFEINMTHTKWDVFILCALTVSRDMWWIGIMRVQLWISMFHISPAIVLIWFDGPSGRILDIRVDVNPTFTKLGMSRKTAETCWDFPMHMGLDQNSFQE